MPVPSLGAVGKLGRRPSDPSRPRLILESYLDPAAVVARPVVRQSVDVDRLSRVPSWPMYANDRIGNCTCAAIGHMIQSWTAYSGTEVTVPEASVIAMYSAVTGYVPGDESTDNGASMADVLAYMHSTGIADETGKVHKVAGYAALGNPADETLLGYVLQTFGSVYAGISCPQSAEDQFGQVWEYVPGSPIAGGHAICLQRRRPVGSAHGVLEYITWGAAQRTTFAFQAHYCGGGNGEAWAVVSEDYLNASGTSPEGMDLDQLLADTSSL